MGGEGRGWSERSEGSQKSIASARSGALSPALVFSLYLTVELSRVNNVRWDSNLKVPEPSLPTADALSLIIATPSSPSPPPPVLHQPSRLGNLPFIRKLRFRPGLSVNFIFAAEAGVAPPADFWRGAGSDPLARSRAFVRSTRIHHHRRSSFPRRFPSKRKPNSSRMIRSLIYSLLLEGTTLDIFSRGFTRRCNCSQLMMSQESEECLSLFLARLFIILSMVNRREDGPTIGICPMNKCCHWTNIARPAWVRLGLGLD